MGDSSWKRAGLSSGVLRGLLKVDQGFCEAGVKSGFVLAFFPVVKGEGFPCMNLDRKCLRAIILFFFPVPRSTGKSNTDLTVPKGCGCSACASWPFSFPPHPPRIWYAKSNHALLTRFPRGERWPLNHNMIADDVAEGENEMNFKLPFALQICSCLPS